MNEVITMELRSGLARLWHSLVFRGLVAIAFGVFALFQPAMSALVLAFAFGVYAIVDGILALRSGLHARRARQRYWPLFVESAISILAGVFAFTTPSIAIFALLIAVAFRAVLVGILQIADVFQHRASTEPRWLAAISGAASIAFGVILFGWPGPGVVALVWLIGLYATVVGVLLFAGGLAIRHWMGSPHPPYRPEARHA